MVGLVALKLIRTHSEAAQSGAGLARSSFVPWCSRFLHSRLCLLEEANTLVPFRLSVNGSADGLHVLNKSSSGTRTSWSANGRAERPAFGRRNREESLRNGKTENGKNGERDSLALDYQITRMRKTVL